MHSSYSSSMANTFNILTAKVCLIMLRASCDLQLTVSFQLCTAFYSRVMKKQPSQTTVCGNHLVVVLPSLCRPKSVLQPNFGQYWLYLYVVWLVTCALNFKNGEEGNNLGGWGIKYLLMKWHILKWPFTDMNYCLPFAFLVVNWHYVTKI